MTSSNGNLSALLALCAGNSLVTGEFPSQRSVTRNFDVSLICALNKRLSKQSWGWCDLRRHCNVSRLTPRQQIFSFFLIAVFWFKFHVPFSSIGSDDDVASWTYADLMVNWTIGSRSQKENDEMSCAKWGPQCVKVTSVLYSTCQLHDAAGLCM